MFIKGGWPVDKSNRPLPFVNQGNRGVKRNCLPPLTHGYEGQKCPMRNRVNRTSWSNPWKFYCGLDIEEIIDLDSKYAIRIWKFSNTKNLDDYRYLYIQSDMFLIAKVFKSFRYINLIHIMLILDNFMQLLD